MLGGEWPERINAACKSYYADGGGGSDELDLKAMLLENTRDLFTQQQESGESLQGNGFTGSNIPLDRIVCETLVTALNNNPDWPWGEYKRGKPLTAHQLSRLLRDFKITARQSRDGNKGERYRTYFLEDFVKTFERYL